MKKIEAIIRPGKVGAVGSALKKIGNAGLMIMEIEGYGQQRGIEQQFRGKTYKTELISKAKLEIMVKDEDADKVIKAIREAAYTGKEGDGKIFIFQMENAIRIRTNEQGEAVI